MKQPNFEKQQEDARWTQAVNSISLLTPSQKVDLLRELTAEIRQMIKTGGLVGVDI